MTLKEFLDYRVSCPLCDASLQTRFHSERQQKIRYEENKINFIVNMGRMKAKEQDYKVAYSFDLCGDSFKIEVYKKGDPPYGSHFDKSVPIDILKKFKALNQNLSISLDTYSDPKLRTQHNHIAMYKIYKYCRGCNKYQYSSAPFKLYLEEAKYEIPVVSTEYFGMYQKVQDTYKVYRLFNHYHAGISQIHFGRFRNEWIVDLHVGSPPERLDSIETPIINFVSPEETMKRLNTLIIFS